MGSLAAIRELIKIKDRDVSLMNEKLYTRRINLTYSLFNTVSLHEAFSRKHEELCMSTVIWLLENGEIEIHNNNMDTCLADASYAPNSFYLYFKGHSNIIWCDASKREIHRYDPQFPSSAYPSIDEIMGDYWRHVLPNYTYKGNSLQSNECIQAVRGGERGYIDCFCQEYTLLYANNRLNGMNHHQAAYDLIRGRKSILRRIEELYSSLVNG